MSQAAPWSAILIHNLLDAGSPVPLTLPTPMLAVLDQYRRLHEAYQPEDAKYLENHRGHLMFLREQEKSLLTPELVRATTMSGTQSELVDRFRALESAGYSQVAVQVVAGEEQALEDWAEVFSRV